MKKTFSTTRQSATLAPSRRHLMKSLKAAIAGSLIAGTVSLPALAADTIKVGVLHSLSGTMAISETTLKDTMLMLIEQQNAAGGVLGNVRQLDFCFT